jgi:hypothetical protein
LPDIFGTNSTFGIDSKIPIKTAKAIRAENFSPGKTLKAPGFLLLQE